MVANSHITIITNNSNLVNNTIQIGEESIIQLYNIRAESPLSNNIPILLKNPELISKWQRAYLTRPIFMDKK